MYKAVVSEGIFGTRRLYTNLNSQMSEKNETLRAFNTFAE